MRVSKVKWCQLPKISCRGAEPAGANCGLPELFTSLSRTSNDKRKPVVKKKKENHQGSLPLIQNMFVFFKLICKTSLMWFFFFLPCNLRHDDLISTCLLSSPFVRPVLLTPDPPPSLPPSLPLLPRGVAPLLTPTKPLTRLAALQEGTWGWWRGRRVGEPPPESKQASKREGVTCEQIPVSRRLKSKIWLWASCATNVDFVLLPRHVKFYFNMLANGIKLISVRPVLFLKRDELSPVQYSSPVRVVIRFICCCMFTKVVKVATRS